MTRARERLLLSYAARRTRHGADGTTGRSSFLAVLDPVPPGLTAARRPRRPADRQLRLL
jgi:DNA helicase II / ATP-dependent DNA helicase PcrA